MANSKNYTILYSPFGNGGFSGYDTIQGQSGIDAARKHINGRFRYVKLSTQKQFNLCLEEGRFDRRSDSIIKDSGSENTGKLYYWCYN